MPFQFVLLLYGTDYLLMWYLHPLCYHLRIVLKMLIWHTLHLVRYNSILSMFLCLVYYSFFVYYFWSRVSGIYLSCFGLLCHYSILYRFVLSLVLRGFANK